MSRSFKLRKRQRGDVLLESLIGILLMSIVGLGITYASSRAAVSQRDMKLQNMVVNQMRNLLEQYGAQLCDSNNAALLVVSMPGQANPIQFTATCTSAPVITINNTTPNGGTAQRSVVLTTKSAQIALFGGTIRVGDDS